ncbi:hypothetical protein HK102_008075 [Quaeritorhiza haematococci]|nr:hypothetical protein HK102_008075 [Quaeritorhiza haematococci]
MEVLETIRQKIIDGNIDDAIALIKDVQPSVLDNSSLLFQLYRQQFAEYVRSSKAFSPSADPTSAINYVQNHLAKHALDAYPEAYAEFKSTLLMLIFKAQQPQQVKSPAPGASSADLNVDDDQNPSNESLVDVEW